MKVRYIIVESDNDDEEDFVKECKGRQADEENPPQFIIKFIKKCNQESADKEAETIRESYPDVTIVIISSKALTGSKEQKLLYKMKLFNAFYEGEGDIEKAIEDLGGDAEDIYVYPVEP